MPQTLNIGLLRCDEVDPESQPEHGCYHNIYASSLNAIDPDLVLHDIACHLGEFPASVADFDAYLISGSRYSVYDPYPWIQQLTSFIHQCQTNRKKCVGICFGHELIAQALGGKVDKSEKGWGIGIHTSQIIANAGWQSASIDAFNLLIFHQDQVLKIPNGFRCLASNSFCEISMMTDDTTFLGIQGHPEFTKAYCEYRINVRKDHIPAITFQKGLDSLMNKLDSTEVIRWISRFLRYQD